MTRSMRSSLISHWPEYLMEAWALGCFMIAVGSLVTLFEAPGSPLSIALPEGRARVEILAAAIGLVLALLIHSPWGKRSGAHMNPAITIAFLRLKKIHPWDALFYVLAQCAGGTLGIVLVARFAGALFTEPPVQYAETLPGPAGAIVALFAEIAISFLLMSAILIFTASPRLIRFTGTAIGVLVTLLIVAEAPISGASMNPARTLASAVPGGAWHHVWIYLLGPTAGMLLAAQVQLTARRYNPPGCAKLLHPRDVPCIHCGYLSKN